MTEVWQDGSWQDFDFDDTIAPNSDQLNADDLIAGMILVTITDVSRGTPDQPILIHIEGKRPLKPFRPCKSMRRVLIAAWGKNGKAWIGKRLALFNDTEVTWAGKKEGGVRISRMSGIDEPMTLMLTYKRGKRRPFTVHPLTDEDEPASYPQALFEKNIKAWTDMVIAGELTVEQIIERAGQRAPLTDAQIETLNEATK